MILLLLMFISKTREGIIYMTNRTFALGVFQPILAVVFDFFTSREL